MNESAARLTVRRLNVDVSYSTCKSEKNCCSHKRRGVCEYMKYFTDVPEVEEPAQRL